jgi:hypothetical protein
MANGTQSKFSTTIRNLFLLGFAIFVFNAFFPILSSTNSEPTYSGTSKNTESISRRLCEDGIRGWAKHPSTVDIHSIMGYGSKVISTGERLIVQSFTARNSFGLELTYQAQCVVQPDGTLQINIAEKSGQSVTTSTPSPLSATRKCFGKSPPGTNPHCYYEN